MEFREFTRAIRSAAAGMGIRVPMMKMNDAIGLACFNKRYSALVAADRAGKLGKIVLPPPYLDAAAQKYRIDPGLFARAFPQSLDDLGLQVSAHPALNT